MFTTQERRDMIKAALRIMLDSMTQDSIFNYSCTVVRAMDGLSWDDLEAVIFEVMKEREND